MAGKPTEPADLSSWEPMNSRPTAGEAKWDWVLCMWVKVVQLDLFEEPLTMGQDLSLAHELAFWCPFPVVGGLIQL